jgi:hypothetical protein
MERRWKIPPLARTLTPWQWVGVVGRKVMSQAENQVAPSAELVCNSEAALVQFLGILLAVTLNQNVLPLSLKPGS